MASGARPLSAEACVAPAYFVAVDNTSRYRDVPGYLQVSLARPAFTLPNLDCLVRTLKASYFSDFGLTIFVFDQRYYAGEFVPALMEPTEKALLTYQQLRAMYVFEPSKHQESITITPLGYGSDSRFDSRIDVASAAPQHCRYGLKNRCLFAVDAQGLDNDERLSGFSGAVVVKGAIGPGGDVRRARITATRGTSAPTLKRVSTTALASMKTWWFEPASREDSVQITFLFGNEATPSNSGSELTLVLSNSFTVIGDTLR